MAMASMHWDLENYGEVEKIFRQSAEFCSENETRKLNGALLLHAGRQVQGGHQILRALREEAPDNLLGITAIILANSAWRTS